MAQKSPTREITPIGSGFLLTSKGCTATFNLTVEGTLISHTRSPQG